MTNQDINNKLESLVGGRYTEQSLNAKLSQLFGCKVETSEYDKEECVKRDLPHLDEQLLFPIENDTIGLQIDVDLFYLKDKANNYYITETCFNYW